MGQQGDSPCMQVKKTDIVGLFCQTVMTGHTEDVNVWRIDKTTIGSAEFGRLPERGRNGWSLLQIIER